MVIGPFRPRVPVAGSNRATARYEQLGRSQARLLGYTADNHPGRTSVTGLTIERVFCNLAKGKGGAGD